MRVGYVCSGGHTELGARMLASGERELAAIDAFLRKIEPGLISFERLFPAHQKPGPKHKPGHPPASLKDENAGGVTGNGLLDRMEARLTKYYRGPSCGFDVIVLIDDADCRFLDHHAFESWRSEVEEKIRDWTDRPQLVFLPMLASPEIETWLLADWDEGFGREYAPIQVSFRRALGHPDVLGPGPWLDVETFGAPYDPSKGSCTRKLSDEVNKVLGRLAQVAGPNVDPKAYTYSKRENGPDMLRRVRPEEVAKLCRLFFREPLHALQAMARGT